MNQAHMKRTPLTLFAALALALMLAGCAGNPPEAPIPDPDDLAAAAAVKDDASFDEVRAQVRRQGRSAAARHWDQNHVREAAARFTPILSACNTSAPDGAAVNFTLLVRLAQDGRATRLLVSPGTPYAECFRDGVARLDFPPAPWEGYWLEVAVRQ